MSVLNLRLKTHELLRNRPATVTLLAVATGSGLTLDWVKKFHSRGSIAVDTSVDKVQTLYEYLTKTTLI